MPHETTRNRWDVTPAETMAAYMNDREDELLDAVVTAAALVARADNRIEPVERGLLVDFMDRNGFLSVFTRARILDAFERSLRRLDERGGADAAIDGLGRFAGRLPARLVIEAGVHVAAANGHLRPAELQVLKLIRAVLAAPRSRSAPNLSRSGGPR